MTKTLKQKTTPGAYLETKVAVLIRECLKCARFMQVLILHLADKNQAVYLALHVLTPSGDPNNFRLTRRLFINVVICSISVRQSGAFW